MDEERIEPKWTTIMVSPPTVKLLRQIERDQGESNERIILRLLKTYHAYKEAKRDGKI